MSVLIISIRVMYAMQAADAYTVHCSENLQLNLLIYQYYYCIIVLYW